MIKVLFICLGNICRSPTAEGIFRQQVIDAGLADRFFIDSAGTSGWHLDKAPDARSQEAALARGYDLSQQKSRPLFAEDLEEFDYLLVMDNSNLTDTQALAQQPNQLDKIELMLSYGSSNIKEVPDPYYGGAAGFTQVINLLEDSCAGLLQQLRQRHAL